MVWPKDDYSDESFESTDESDAAQNLIDQPSVTHKVYEKTNELINFTLSDIHLT